MSDDKKNPDYGEFFSKEIEEERVFVWNHENGLNSERDFQVVSIIGVGDMCVDYATGEAVINMPYQNDTKAFRENDLARRLITDLEKRDYKIDERVKQEGYEIGELPPVE
tara:strand:+ start:1010 stop:1339 length:330 start_codon:yes stop_codon:yes gene_type:complete